MFSIPITNKYGLCPQPALQEFRLSPVKKRKNLLLDLPHELRNAIYELVGNECAPMRYIPIETWRAPHLAQVNRQLRNEFIPAFFGRKGGFKLIQSFEYDRPYDRMFCKKLPQHLQYVRHLEIHLQYRGMLRTRPGIVSRVAINLFLIFSESCVAGGKTGRRIGNDETDWDDDTAAAMEFEAAIHNFEFFLGPFLDSELRPFYPDLRFLAKQLKLANRWIQLTHGDKNTLSILGEMVDPY